MKYYICLIFLYLLACTSKKITPSIPSELQKLINSQSVDYCKKNFMGLNIDEETYCTNLTEYKSSLNSSYDNEDRDDLLKFWYYFDVDSKKHPKWKAIYYIGTVPNINNTGDFAFDNSDYNYKASQNSYNKRTSFIWIETEDSKGDWWSNTQNQYVIQESIFRITNYSKEQISGKFAVIAKKQDGEILKFTGSFDELNVK